MYKTNQHGSRFVEITPAERKAYAANLEGKSISVVNRATGETKAIRFGVSIYGIDITPDEIGCAD